MEKIFVISDLHFGHVGMALKRGFFDCVQHDSQIIDEWNSVITQNDKVVILGDIAFNKQGLYRFMELNGVKRVVLGNHDHSETVKFLVNNGIKCVGVFEHGGDVFTHIPIHETQFDSRWKRNFHGHVHDRVSSLNSDKRYINVCVDVIGFIPLDINKLVFDKKIH